MTEPTSNGVKYIERSDIWRTDNSCLVCQSVCSSSEDKRKHEELPKHVKKLKIYDFFAKEAANLPSSDKPSSLMKRYQRTREKAVGLECIHELQFPWSTSSWWACSICYDSGCVYEQADQHLMSLNHLQTYIVSYYI
uniref:C2H2-type domain-containing protein n=1 Tax=Heterorhabditis bacteriophora TaxID=37862 RepID=A0A1I7XDH6_HETBA